MAQQLFESILDMPSSEVERPKPLPVGSYVGVVQGQPRMDKSSKKGTEFVEFTIKLLQALDDVNSDKLEEMGGIGDKSVKATYYLTENSVWRLKDFLDHCEAGDNDMTLGQRVSETPGKSITVKIRHELTQDGSYTVARVGDTAPVK